MAGSDPAGARRGLRRDQLPRLRRRRRRRLRPRRGGGAASAHARAVEGRHTPGPVLAGADTREADARPGTGLRLRRKGRPRLARPRTPRVLTPRRVRTPQWPPRPRSFLRSARASARAPAARRGAASGLVILGAADTAAVGVPQLTQEAIDSWWLTPRPTPRQSECLIILHETIEMLSSFQPLIAVRRVPPLTLENRPRPAAPRVNTRVCSRRRCRARQAAAARDSDKGLGGPKPETRSAATGDARCPPRAVPAPAGRLDLVSFLPP